jgi:hypothetical protein
MSEERPVPSPDHRVKSLVLYVAVCGECGESPDADGLEFTKTPQQAIDFALSGEETYTEEPWQERDGKLVCDDCILGELGAESDE